MQRLIELGGGLLPFGGIEGEDRADRHVRDRGDVCIPGIKLGSRDDVRQPGGLLGSAQRGDSDQFKEFQAGKEIVALLAAGIE